jgi:hypothetical protein
MWGEAGRSRTSSLLGAMALLLICSAAVLMGQWADRGAKSNGPESPLVSYASAVGRGDLASALQQLMPGLREGSSSFVEWQLGNRYTILESAVRTVAPIDRALGHADGSHATVVVTMEIDGKGNPLWRTTEEMPVQLVDGRWYLAKTPLELPN